MAHVMCLKSIIFVSIQCFSVTLRRVGGVFKSSAERI